MDARRMNIKREGSVNGPKKVEIGGKLEWKGGRNGKKNCWPSSNYKIDGKLFPILDGGRSKHENLLDAYCNVPSDHLSFPLVFY